MKVESITNRGKYRLELVDKKYRQIFTESQEWKYLGSFDKPPKPGNGKEPYSKRYPYVFKVRIGEKNFIFKEKSTADIEFEMYREAASRWNGEILGKIVGLITNTNQENKERILVLKDEGLLDLGYAIFGGYLDLENVQTRKNTAGQCLTILGIFHGKIEMAHLDLGNLRQFLCSLKREGEKIRVDKVEKLIDLETAKDLRFIEQEERSIKEMRDLSFLFHELETLRIVRSPEEKLRALLSYLETRGEFSRGVAIERQLSLIEEQINDCLSDGDLDQFLSEQVETISNRDNNQESCLRREFFYQLFLLKDLLIQEREGGIRYVLELLAGKRHPFQFTIKEPAWINRWVDEKFVREIIEDTKEILSSWILSPEEREELLRVVNQERG